MSEPRPQPLRSLHGANGPNTELRSLLEASDAHEPTPADLASLGKRLAAALPPGTLPGAGGAPPPAAPPTAPVPGGLLASAGSKLLVAVAITGAIAGGVWVGRSDPSQITRPSSTDLAPSVTVSSPASVVPPSSSASATLTSEPSASATTAVVRPSTASARPEPVAPSEPEATILARAHDELLRGAPEKALATTNEHARGYPKGMLAQEREVIAIEALVRLGRRDEARRRADSFHRAYPGSSHVDRVERLVEGP